MSTWIIFICRWFYFPAVAIYFDDAFIRNDVLLDLTIRNTLWENVVKSILWTKHILRYGKFYVWSGWNVNLFRRLTPRSIDICVHLLYFQHLYFFYTFFILITLFVTTVFVNDTNQCWARLNYMISSKR